MPSLTIKYTAKGRGYSKAWESGENPAQGCYKTKWSQASQWGEFTFNDSRLSNFNYDLNTITKISVTLVMADGGASSSHNISLHFRQARSSNYSSYTPTIRSVSDGHTGTYTLSWTSAEDIAKFVSSGKSYKNIYISFYNGEKTLWSDKNYSRHYTRMSSATLVIEYVEGSALRYYDGSTFINCRAKYWDGSAWKNVKTRYWDGTQWKEC